MQDLSNLFGDLLEDPKITNNRKVIFGNDQIVRLTDNNPAGIYTPIITATTAAVNALSVIIVARESDTSTREGSTVTKNRTRTALVEFISRKEGLIKSVFGKTSGQYQEFFPQGLSAFHSGTEMEFNNAAKVVLEKAHKFEIELGSAFVTELNSLYEFWDTAYNRKNNDTVTADNDGSEEATKAKELQLQLTKNALFIAYNNVGVATAYATYFDTALLFAPHRTRIYKGTVAANTVSMVHEVEYSAGKKFHMKNKGAVDLSFQLWLGETPVGNTFTVQPGKTVKKSMSDFFGLGDNLRVTNSSTTTAGAYEVRQLA